MDKKSKETIKEVIKSILKVRKDYTHTCEAFRDPSPLVKLTELESKTLKSFFNQIQKLNMLLEVSERNKEVLDIEKQMQKIQVKKNINVKEFSEIYHLSKTSQQNYRGRIHDPLPYHQKVQGGKIVYVVEEVEQWFDNQHK